MAKKTKQIKLSIIIVSFNTKDTTRDCLDCVHRFSRDISNEVFVVDNASTDGSQDMVKHEFPWVRLICLDTNIGFAAGNNVGIRQASGEYILLLNTDAFIARGVLEKTIGFMDQYPSIGILGCKLTNPDGTMQPSARMLPSPLNKALVMTGLSSRWPHSRFFGRVDYTWWDHSYPKGIGWVVGAYFLIRSSMIDDIGYLDERYFLYSEEIDYCKSARKARWDVVFYPHARVIHLGGQSASKTTMKMSDKGSQLVYHRLKSEFRYYRKWFGIPGVLLSSGMELSWKSLVLAKNMLSIKPSAKYKRKEALTSILTTLKILFEDNLGKGVQ